MHRTTSKVAIAAAAVLAVAVLAPGAASATDRTPAPNADLDAVGLTDGGRAVVSFNTSNADTVRHLGAVTGLVGDTSLVGIDYRVQNGKLYSVGNSGGIYTHDGPRATKVGQLSVALSGTAFGVDFNPAANALRVVSDTGQNLRQPFPAAVGATFADGPVAGSTVVDGPLTNPAAAPATGTTPATGITGAAYTNNDLNADTSTVLYDLDSALNRVSLQSPANAGTLAPIGILRVDASTDAGFDIYSTVRDGRTSAVQGFAVSRPSNDDPYRLYSINLATGEASDRGGFGKDVTDIAIALDQG